MLTFLKSHVRSYRSSVPARGFSLVELTVVIGILIMISAVMVTRFSVFDSTVLLKGLAYDIAASLREAQVYSLSAFGSTSDTNQFDSPYGMSFTPSTKEYYFFRYDGSGYPEYTIGSITNLDVFTIGRNMEIYDVCVRMVGETTDDCTIDRLDISFKRPEFQALFNAPGVTSSNIEYGIVKVKSPNGDDIWTITVSLLGQISVVLE